MNTFLARLRRLPKVPLVLQGGVFEWPSEVHGPEGLPCRPRMPIWIDAESGVVHASEPMAPGEDLSAAALETLATFVQRLMHNQACPQRVEVSDPQLADYLRKELSGTGIDVGFEEQLPQLQAAFAALTDMIDGTDRVPGLLDSRGVTVERLRSFAEAAADYYRAAPWQHLSDSDLIHVETPKPPRGMACCVVLGAGGTATGLALYPSRAAYDRFLQAGLAGKTGPEIAAGLMQLMFDSADENPPGDTQLWREHELPVAGEAAYPFVMKYLIGVGTAH